MNNFKDTLSLNLFGLSRKTWAVASKTCVKCGKSANRFADELSKKEFGISGFCQGCQDKFFFCEDMSDEGLFF